MSLVSWLPTMGTRAESGQAPHPFTALQNEINRAFDQAFRGFDVPTFKPLDRLLAPAVDVKETAEGLEVAAELPGVDEKDLEVTVADGLLSIKAEKKLEETKDEKGYHLMERRYGTASRTIQLPFSPEADKVTASFEKGVLRIVVPRPAEAAEKIRRVPVKPAT